MPKIEYQEFNFREKTLEVIRNANAILREYAEQGFDLTLRQLYYQFVSRGLIPNNQNEYKKLGSIINDARLAGYIDWDHIVDRTRNVRALPHWSDTKSILDSCAAQFRFDKWAGQPYRVEVWIEKDALTGVIAGVCNELQVPYFSCRGYCSQSEMWTAGQRFLRHIRDGQDVLVLHLGDHDASGLDMTRDIQDRLNMFVGKNRVNVKRIALNMDQVEEYDPPPNPAKESDSRSAWYIEEFGESSWELDALPPTVIAGLIRENVLDVRNERQWQSAVDRENQAKWRLALLAQDGGSL